MAVLREVIERDRYFMSPRVKRLRAILGQAGAAAPTTAVHRSKAGRRAKPFAGNPREVSNSVSMNFVDFRAALQRSCRLWFWGENVMSDVIPFPTIDPDVQAFARACAAWDACDYEKAQQLDPKHAHAAEALKRLKN